MTGKTKLKFQTDDRNRLMIRRGNSSLVASGSFVSIRPNSLSYILNEPSAWKVRHSLPDRIDLEGKWRLDPEHDLVLDISRSDKFYSEGRIVLKGDIIDVSADSLAFQINCVDRSGLSHIRVIKLSGAWQADEFNRLTFLVKKEGLPDILTLEGRWEVSEDQEIIYTYAKTRLKRKTRYDNTLTFKGFWYINDSDKLSFVLGEGSKSRFDFRAQIESADLYPKQGVIKYRLGIGLSQARPKKQRVISLFGQWRFSRGLGIDFLMDYGPQGIRKTAVQSLVNFGLKNKVVFSLINRNGQSIGIDLVFTRKILKQLDGEAYIKLDKIERDAAIEAGIKIPF